MQRNSSQQHLSLLYSMRLSIQRANQESIISNKREKIPMMPWDLSSHMLKWIQIKTRMPIEIQMSLTSRLMGKLLIKKTINLLQLRIHKLKVTPTSLESRHQDNRLKRSKSSLTWILPIWINLNSKGKKS